MTISKDVQFIDDIDQGFRAPGELVVTKTVTDTNGAPAYAGDQLDYRITVTNNSDRDYTAFYPARVVDDLSGVEDAGGLIQGSAVASAGEVLVMGPIGQQQLVWFGPLAAGASVTIDYAVAVRGGGDNALTNIAFRSDLPIRQFDPEAPLTPGVGLPVGPGTGQVIQPGDPASPTPTSGRPIGPVEVPADCVAPGCASITTPVETRVVDPLPEPALAVAKSASVAQVLVGGKVTYTITVTNTGSGSFTESAPAMVVDDLSGVLDDASMDGQPTISAGRAVFHGSTLAWSGPLAPGASATISYTVVVKSGGDKVAKNVVFDTTGWPTDPLTGIPTDPVSGGPAAAPADCVAPGCASTSTAVVVRPDKLPTTGAGDAGLALAAFGLLSLTLGAAWLRRRG